MSSARQFEVNKLQSELRAHLRCHHEKMSKDTLSSLDVNYKHLESSLLKYLSMCIGEGESSDGVKSQSDVDQSSNQLHAPVLSSQGTTNASGASEASAPAHDSRVKRFLGREEKEKRRQELNRKKRSRSSLQYDKLLTCILECQKYKEPERNGFAARLVSSNGFESTTYFVIFVNTVFSTYVANWELQNLNSDPTLLISLVTIGFTSYYVFELCLRIWVHRMFFFINHEAKWNIFDLLVCFTAAWEVLPLSEIGVDVKFLRTFRIMKLVKVIRVFRVVKAFSELRQMMQAMVGSVMSLSWALLMLSLIIYMFSLFCLQGVIDYRRDQGNDLPKDVRAILDSQFGSLTSTMRAIYIACLTGFYTITVVNIITGIFLEKALVAALPDRAQQMMEERQRVASEANDLAVLIRSMLDNGAEGGSSSSLADTISRRQFQELVDETELAEYLATIEIHIDDAKLFFDVIAALCGADDNIAISDFAGGLASMRGHATSFGVQQLLYGIKYVERTVVKHAQRSNARIDLLEMRLPEKPTVASVTEPLAI